MKCSLGLGIDGVYLYSSKNLCWSTWPMISLCYSLPPWLMTKRNFIMLLLLILSKKSLCSANIDVYLTPLIEELQELWEGVHAHDVLWPLGEHHFLLQYMIFQLMACYQGVKQKDHKVALFVDHMLILNILEYWGKLFIKGIVGTCHKTTHINVMLCNSMGRWKGIQGLCM